VRVSPKPPSRKNAAWRKMQQSRKARRGIEAAKEESESLSAGEWEAPGRPEPPPSPRAMEPSRPGAIERGRTLRGEGRDSSASRPRRFNSPVQLREEQNWGRCSLIDLLVRPVLAAGVGGGAAGLSVHPLYNGRGLPGRGPPRASRRRMRSRRRRAEQLGREGYEPRAGTCFQLVRGRQGVGNEAPLAAGWATGKIDTDGSVYYICPFPSPGSSFSGGTAGSGGFPAFLQ